MTPAIAIVLTALAGAGALFAVERIPLEVTALGIFPLHWSFQDTGPRR